MTRRIAVEVVRHGRFEYVVVERRSDGFDIAWEPSHLFRWTAVRHARRVAAVKPEPIAVLRIETDDQPW